jgi:TPR repeat protein
MSRIFKAKACALTIALVLGSAQMAVAGPFEDGAAAYARGEYAAALTLFRPLAEQGNVNAQNALGVMFVNGEGVAQDYAEAHKWYQRAANQGYAKAQGNLGVMYFNGEGVAQDYIEAYKWFDLAGRGGFEDALKYRGVVSDRMTPEQIEDAQRRAGAWKRIQ